MLADDGPLEIPSVERWPVVGARRRCRPRFHCEFVWRAERVGRIYFLRGWCADAQCNPAHSRQHAQLPADGSAIIRLAQRCTVAAQVFQQTQFAPRIADSRVPFCSVPIWASPEVLNPRASCQSKAHRSETREAKITGVSGFTFIALRVLN